MDEHQEKDKGGAPTKYKTAFNKKAYKLCLMGATDEELADFFDIVESTLNLWKLKHPKFSESIKSGKQAADSNVVESLYKSATGYQFKEVTFEKLDGKESLEALGDDLILTDTYKKRVVTKIQPANVTAAIFWLKNRQGSKWRDKQEIDHTTGGKPLNQQKDLSKLNEDELRQMAEIEAKLNA